MRYGSLYIAALISFSTIATADTVHRWKDENGVINYGHTPPAGVRSTPVQTIDPLRVTRPPGATADSPTAPASPANLDRNAVRDEVEQALRQQSVNQAAEAREQEESARLAARKRCEAQRRVDCDDPAVLDDSLYAVPPRIVRRHFPTQPVYAPIRPPAQPAERPMLMRKLP
ncbi:MAG: DUF4124 domain-containing protein [Methyloversatilis sp.]|uniref:DUF4124 domain-containing protein n=1 Tax=Methyloversatilis sp. TaxID=2569862 RepID=UPI0027355F6A|nr:DUF4124 domain-containing protein [Methyloversatilis sp.]MDP3872882.1 DUF4124 domain-containing protein [Methyloversatilis sp.]